MKNQTHAQFIYREGIESDIEKVRNLTWLAYKQFKHVISAENYEQWKQTLTQHGTYEKLRKIASHFVCEYETRVVGSAFLVRSGNPNEMFDAGWCYLRLVGVHPDFGGRGIGKKLTALCIDKARDLGEQTIALHTSEFQDAARHIYESMGFTKQREFESFGRKYWIYTLTLVNQ
jgi:ribosomal protein S18 acetylase RimI-like enzyme